jgi:hypothetical protein
MYNGSFTTRKPVDLPKRSLPGIDVARQRRNSANHWGQPQAANLLGHVTPAMLGA